MPLHLTGEAAIHVEVVKRLRLAGVPFFHCPSEGMHHVSFRSKLKAMGFSAGIPDLIIIRPPPMFPAMCGTALELKTSTGRTTPAQYQWLDRFAAEGWAARCTYGLADAIECLRSLGYLGYLP